MSIDEDTMALAAIRAAELTTQIEAMQAELDELRDQRKQAMRDGIAAGLSVYRMAKVTDTSHSYVWKITRGDDRSGA